MTRHQQQQLEKQGITAILIGNSNAIKQEPKRKHRMPWRTMWTLLAVASVYLAHSIYEAARAEQEFRAQIAQDN